MNILEKPLKPAEYAERQLLEAIVSSTYKPGEPLPAERVLAQALGITRPTLREALQRLAREGWVTIQHGKATMVKDYLSQGGLGVLATLARFGRGVSHEMVSHLLQVRTIMLPGIARLAVKKDPDALLAYLDQSMGLKEDPEAFVVFDWGLQTLMAKLAGNPVFMMILNDFTPLFEIFGSRYFQHSHARAFSRTYYGRLIQGILEKDTGIQDLVHRIMTRTETIWQETHEPDRQRHSI